MRTPRPLPPQLGTVFSIAQARALGVERGRLDGGDLMSPFRGVRIQMATMSATDAMARDDFEDRVIEVRTLARAYGTRMRQAEFFSHRTAAVLWGAPISISLPVVLDVSVFAPAGIPRCRGICGQGPATEQQWRRAKAGCASPPRPPSGRPLAQCRSTTWSCSETTSAESGARAFFGPMSVSPR